MEDQLGEQLMYTRTVRAHFDGKHIHLDEPCTLEPDFTTGQIFNSF